MQRIEPLFLFVVLALYLFMEKNTHRTSGVFQDALLSFSSSWGQAATAGGV